MKKKKNMAAKIMASIALIAIILGIVGTWALVVVSSLWSSSNSYETEISAEDLKQYIESLSGSTTDSDSSSGVIDIVE